MSDTKNWYKGTYLKSDHWKELRLVKMDEVGHKCQVCGKRHNLEVHHRTYRPYKERLTELQVLCDECHARHHEIEMASKYAKRKQPKNSTPMHWADERRQFMESLSPMLTRMAECRKRGDWVEYFELKKSVDKAKKIHKHQMKRRHE